MKLVSRVVERVGSTRIGRWVAVGLLLGVVAFAAVPARALVVVSLVPSSSSVNVGDTFAVDIVADADNLLLGFGIDVVADSILGSTSLLPSIGPAWTPVLAPDGDGLAGVAPVAGLVGTGLLLASVHFVALAPGVASLDVGATAGDLTEGFPLRAGGFDSFQVLPAAVQVVPEPSTRMLLCLGLALVLARGSWRTRSVRFR